MSTDTPRRADRDRSTPPDRQIVLVGRPNVGKSTIFNSLTGLSQHTGNWPGKTVDIATGFARLTDGTPISVVDLPGTYSLGNSGEADSALDEAVAREYVLETNPDLVLAVVSAAALQQDLYLVAQLLSLPVAVIVVANMADVAARHGLEIDYKLLSRRLGTRVIPMSATHPADIRRLGTAVAATLSKLRAPRAPRAGPVPDPSDPPAIHRWVDQVISGAIEETADGPTPSQRIDALILHPWAGLVVMLAVLAGIFWLTFGIGQPLQELLEEGFIAPLTALAGRLLSGAPDWFRGLIVDGVLTGAGTVVTFLPILAIFFAALAFLEDLGYLARTAVVMDRFMHRLGLHGKSFIPLFLGFGCNVPAVMGVRTIESRRGRVLTAVLAPLVPCAARMAVLSVIAGVFFGERAPVVVWALVTVNLLCLSGLGVVLSRTLLHDPEDRELLMELPPYQFPSLRVTGFVLWRKLWSFLSKAGTVIVIASAIVWALAYFPDGELDRSYLAAAGRFVEPVGLLAGLDWRLVLATLSGFVAKENSLATLAVLYGVGSSGGSLAQTLTAAISPPSALSFLVTVMLFMPCVATVAVMRQELKSWTWVLLTLVILFVLSFSAAAAVFQLTSILW